jgi:uncharacterized membrane protein YgaE (UPF0421/DUF939 family)
MTGADTPGDRAEAGAAVERGRFALRCAAAAVLAYVAAGYAGLPHPVWAPMSALIVSQERVGATLVSVAGRVLGTLIGVAVALVVHWVGHACAVPTVLQIAIAVALCALCASDHPAIRVSLWTCPLVLIAASPEDTAASTALFRGSEVMLGAVVGGLVHLCEERVATPLLRSLFTSKKPAG